MDLFRSIAFLKGNFMLNFNFYSPTQFVFGKGEEANIGTLLAARGAKKVLLHYGGQSAEKSGLLGRVRASLQQASVPFIELGGGTYARKLPGRAVAFGMEFPGQPATAHMADEYMDVKELVLNAKIIAHAIYALATEN